jgi:brefeldin A-resistance guanine nucleotide exchange factor 1
MTALIQALLEQLPQDPSPMVIIPKQEPSSPNPKNNPNRTTISTSYDPRVVYILELASGLATRDEATVAAVGKDVVEALQTIVRNSSNSHPLVVSRAVYYLLHLLSASHVSLTQVLLLIRLTSVRNITLYVLLLSCMPFLV